MIPRNIELSIEELVLSGFAPENRYLIAEAVERELTRLLSEQGIPSNLTQMREVDRFDGGSFTVTSNTKPEAIGTQIAQRIYGGLSQMPAPDSSLNYSPITHFD